jgi:hypothetical protein
LKQISSIQNPFIKKSSFITRKGKKIANRAVLLIEGQREIMLAQKRRLRNRNDFIARHL